MAMFNDEKILIDSEDNFDKKTLLKDIISKSLPQYEDFFMFIRKSLEKKKLNQFDLKIKDKELKNLGAIFLGDNRQKNLVKISSMYIVKMFYEFFFVERYDTLNDDIFNKLEKVFDKKNITLKLIVNASDISKYLFDLVDEEELHFFYRTLIGHDDKINIELSEIKNDTFEENKTDKRIENLLKFNVIENKEIKKEYLDNNSIQDEHNIQSSDSELDIIWLNEELQKYLTNKKTDFKIEDLIEFIISILNCKQEELEDIQTDLINLLGLSNIDLISNIILNRNSIIKSYKDFYLIKQTSSSYKNNYNISNLQKKKKQVFFKEMNVPSFTQTITIQTEEEVKTQKFLNKIEKKMYQDKKKEEIILQKKSKEININTSFENEERSKFLNLSDNTESSFFNLIKPTIEDPLLQEDFPYVFDIFIDIKKNSLVSSKKLLLPENTEMKDIKSYTEIKVPAPEKINNKLLEKYPLISIKNLDPLGQKLFFGFKTLNQIQSVVFETATKTNENMLICAPTGAGKTNIALLAILNEIQRNFDPLTKKVNKDNFKIIYIAPMKALASEMADNFSKRIKSLDLTVHELSGDIQLTKHEIMKTQVIVTTPEKWDVITRKSKENLQLMSLVSLLVIDEIHLIQSDRGPVIEALVARTLRYVESTQKMIRIIGLSATLPNYIDIALFLRVNLKVGLFYFDSRFRPVPLSQTFIGCKSSDKKQINLDMNELCFEKVIKYVQQGHQCMIFVHTRNSTLKTAINLKDRSIKAGLSGVFSKELDFYQKRIVNSLRNNQLKDLVYDGLAIHHAGLLRHDRNIVETMFKEGVVKVLISTATLAWGVNLPAHAVIIKGTEMYDPEKGGFVDVDTLDIVQIFGRAGRPQFDSEGHATIITSHDKLKYYLSILTNQCPIESKFLKSLTNNLNAEIVSRTITTIEEAIEWMSYTYLFIRMQKNPKIYGISNKILQDDPDLYNFRCDYIINSVKKLDKAKMTRFDPVSGTLDPTDLGTTASYYYIKYETIEYFNNYLSDSLLEDELLSLLCLASEFQQIQSREEELDELIHLKKLNCKLKVPLTPDHKECKINILLQSYLSRSDIKSFSLVSDMFFIQQNARRIVRGFFEYIIKRRMPLLSRKLLTFSKMFELEMWDFETPFKQFGKLIDFMDIEKLERHKIPLFKIRSSEFNYKELGLLLRCGIKQAQQIKRIANCLSLLSIEINFRPITGSILQVILQITPEFEWDNKIHGKLWETFWIWMEDDNSSHIYHYENFKLTRKQVINKETQTLSFTVPLLDPGNIPTHYIIHYDSDKWLGCSHDIVANCENLKLPENFLPFTNLLNLFPLPVTSLQNELYQSFYKFTHFNPIQTQIFHTIYHTDHNVLLGAPTGSGKTIAAEIAIFRVFNKYVNSKVVYIGPLKALVSERVLDWKKKFEKILDKKIIELTGDTTPDIRAIKKSDIIVTTPEKWDGISRNWSTRKYVQDVKLIIMDEIHLLGENRGPVLEVIVSRTNFINQHTGHKIRLIGLSTAIANAQDLAYWLNIKKIGLYNFKPSVRPVPLEVHVSGYPGKHYCPRMASMNKPVFRAIQQHSKNNPVIVFVSSRRQTRLTALDLISFIAHDNPKQWIKISDEDMNYIINNLIKDSNLKLTLSFGIGLHHAGLNEKDRLLVEELFAYNQIQILISTSTLAWGVNLPAHLVIVKGTEYYDGKTHKYVDFPITDVLQMIGRAGRPQFDTFGKAVILVHDIKKEYYKKFLYEPFPVESRLIEALPEHLNAEIVAGTIKTRNDCVQYLSWTFLFRRMLKNPSYYNLLSSDLSDVNIFLSNLIEKNISELINCFCIEEKEECLEKLPLGQICSFYYLNHKTVQIFFLKINEKNLDFENLLWILSRALEFSELPVRHNEEILNKELCQECRYKVKDESYDNSNTKTFILLQAHFSRLELPCSDYLTDLKSVIDQCIRVLQAMIDISAMKGYSGTSIKLIIILQMIIQARWFDDESILIMPNLDRDDLSAFFNLNLPCNLPQLISVVEMYSILLSSKLRSKTNLSEEAIHSIYQALGNYPLIDITAQLIDMETGDKIDNFHLNHPYDTDNSNNWLKVKASTEYILQLSFRKIKSKIPGIIYKQKALTPKYNKSKDENWFLILELRDDEELVAMKRFSTIKTDQKHIESLIFKTPEYSGKLIYTFYFLSDCYIGLDQQYILNLDLETENQI